jgi:hypothetical protein
MSIKPEPSLPGAAKASPLVPGSRRLAWAMGIEDDMLGAGSLANDCKLSSENNTEFSLR